MSKVLTLKRLFFTIIIIASILIWWFTKRTDSATYLGSAQENNPIETSLKINQCENQIIQLNDSIEMLNKMISNYKKRIDVLTTNSVSIYKKHGNEKIYILPKSDYVDITEFLADRYKDSAR